MKMKADFEITDLGSLGYFLGLEFTRTIDGMIMHQMRYISKVLKRFGMEGCNSVNVPVMANTKLTIQADDNKVDATLFKQIVGSLGYVCNSRPNISYGVRLVSRFMGDPKQSRLFVANIYYAI